MADATGASDRRTAIVTGASSGIGEATARALAAAGFDVAMIARRGDRLEQIAKEIEQAGARAHPLVADLASEEATDAVFEAALAALGHVDLLVNNAGYSPGAAIEQMTRAEIGRVFEVNLLAALQLASRVVPSMRASGGGRIVNVGSLAGEVPAPLAIPYGSSKKALHVASDALRLELAPFGIRVSTIIAGFVDTAVFDNAREGSEALRQDPTNPYRQTFFDLDELALRNLKHALAPADVADVVVRAATARRPRERYYIPRSARAQSVLMRLLPAPWLDGLLRRVYKLERR